MLGVQYRSLTTGSPPLKESTQLGTDPTVNKKADSPRERLPALDLGGPKVRTLGAEDCG